MLSKRTASSWNTLAASRSRRAPSTVPERVDIWAMTVIRMLDLVFVLLTSCRAARTKAVGTDAQLLPMQKAEPASERHRRLRTICRPHRRTIAPSFGMPERCHNLGSDNLGVITIGATTRPSF